MDKGDTQSVILNFNKNYANSKASQFTQLVNQQLEINPNAMVALYTGNLVRKPIVLPSDTTLTINLTSQQPTKEMTGSIPLSDTQDTYGITSFEATIKQGTYSKLTFCRHLIEQLNTVIQANDLRLSTVYPFGFTEDPALKSLPYKFFYQMKDGNFFLGLRYMLYSELSNTGNDSYQVAFLDLYDKCNTSQAVTFVEDGAQKIIHRTTRVDDWNAYALGNQPIRGMSYCHTDDGFNNKLASDIAFSTCQVQVTPSGANDMGFLYGLNNTYFASKWADVSPPVVETANVAYVSPDDQIPKVLMGLYMSVTTDATSITKSSIKVVVNENLQKLGLFEYQNEANRDDFMNNKFQIVKEIDPVDYNIDLTQLTSIRWEVYCRNGLQDDASDYILNDTRVYFFRVYINSPYQNGSNTLIFDSKTIGLQLNPLAVETGYLWQQIPNYDDANNEVSGGLCPQFFFKNSEDDIVVYNPRQNSIVTLIDDRLNFNINYGMLGYSFEVKDTDNENNTELRSILGVAQNNRPSVLFTDITNTTNYNPNSFPYSEDLGGLTQLGSDRTRYNIELNLPIKAFNTTESTVNNLGQTRTIVYNSNPVIEDVTNVSSGLINGNIEPNTLKFLSLNNERSIKLNQIDVEVRRAKTNEIADEIVDASVELLIQSEPKASTNSLEVLI